MASASSCASRQWMTTGLPSAPGQSELAAEDGGLDVGRRQVAEEVEPHLAERHHLGRVARERLHRGVVGVGGLAGIVRMDADGGEDVGEPLGERDRGGIRLAVGADRHHRGDAGGPRALEHRVEIRRRARGSAGARACRRAASGERARLHGRRWPLPLAPSPVEEEQRDREQRLAHRDDAVEEDAHDEVIQLGHRRGRAAP